MAELHILHDVAKWQQYLIYSEYNVEGSQNSLVLGLSVWGHSSYGEWGNGCMKQLGSGLIL
ncbi:hypothetical protein AA18895_1716 [Acetobacter ghanensis DSM 18895]|nr:hypothetical protein AA18895_1716 [Acetobacter ghanensis DSM 18895]